MRRSVTVTGIDGRRRVSGWAAWALCSGAIALGACDIPRLDNPGADTGLDAGGPPSLEEILRDNVCADLRPQDLECGGLPLGDWEIVRSCPAVSAWDPLGGTCPERTSAGVGDVRGTLSFDLDGSYAITLGPAEMELSFMFPLSCYGGATEPCNGANFGGECELLGDECACNIDRIEPGRAWLGSWFVTGSTLRISSGDEIYAGSVCVEGEHVLRIVLFANDRSEMSWIFIARKTPSVSSEVAP